MAADKKPWVQALGIPDKSFDSWKSETPKGSSVIYWCLKHQKIDVNAYFAWAREHYALPSLEIEFFQNAAPMELWKQIQSVANWSPELLPLGEWDGTIFVGCTEPMLDTRWSFPVQYVLAPPQGLERMWNQLNGGAAAPAPIVATPPLPVVAKPSLKPTAPPFEKPSAPPIVLAPPPVAQTPAIVLEMPVAPPPIVAKAPVVDQPEGIRLDFNATIPEPSTLPKAAEEAPASEMPEGLSFASVKAYPTPPLTLPEDFNTAPRIVLGPEGLSAPGKEIEPPPQAPSVIAKKPADAGPDQHVRSVFTDLNKMFQRSLFLKFQDKEFHVATQDGTWPAQENAQEWFGLQEPSVFRIVSRTGLPYHGYVSSSEFNDSFFKLWGLAGLPEHLTILPIKVSGQVVGAFLAIGGKELNNEKILRQSEKIVEKFSTHMGATDTRAA